MMQENPNEILRERKLTEIQDIKFLTKPSLNFIFEINNLILDF